MIRVTLTTLLLVVTVLVLLILYFPIRGLPVTLYIIWCAVFLIPLLRGKDEKSI